LVELDRRSLAKSVPLVEAFARVEGLEAHGRSARIRLE
jgi:histidinol dehydrogenase